MKKTKRLLSALLAALMILTLTPVLFASAVEDDGIVYQYEAEEVPGSNGGTTLEDSLVCIRDSYEAHVMYGARSNEIIAGRYVVVMYMMMLDKTGYDTAVVSSIDMPTINKQGVENALNATKIYESQFEELNKYYAIEIPVTFQQDIVSTEVRVYFTNVNGVKFDKVLMVKHGSPIPPPREDQAGETKRPDGEPLHDSFIVPLTDESVMRTNTGFGEFIDNRFEMRKMEHVVGSITGMVNPFYLTNGNKTAQFYLRTPSKSTGQFGFFRITVISGGVPVADSRIPCDEFTDYVNQTMLVEFPFRADENKAIDIHIRWYGSYDITVDRIVFSATSGSEAQLLDANSKVTGATSITDFTSDDVVGVSSIDRYAIQYGQSQIYVPVSYLIEWFKTGYTKVTVTVTAPSTASRTMLKDRVSGYEAKTTELSLFTYHIRLADNKGNVQTLTDLISPIQVKTAVPNNVSALFGTGRKLSLNYFSITGSDIATLSGVLSYEDKVVYNTATLKNTGSVMIAVADNS